MNKIKLILVLLSAVLLANTAIAQEVPMLKRAQTISIELAGQGPIISLNYDTRFFKRRDGLGGRAGIGCYVFEDNPITFPLGLNYLFGKEKNFLEIGVGATIVVAGPAGSGFIDDKRSGAIGTMCLAYRLQPLDEGISLRVGYTPLFDSDGFTPLYFGLSLGYTF